MQRIIECELKDLTTESDVEQKFVLPMLINKAPLGLEYGFSDFKTKGNMKKLRYNPRLILRMDLWPDDTKAKRTYDHLRNTTTIEYVNPPTGGQEMKAHVTNIIPLVASDACTSANLITLSNGVRLLGNLG